MDYAIYGDRTHTALRLTLTLKGSSQVMKGGTKSKPIRLVDGDHEISLRWTPKFGSGAKL